MPTMNAVARRLRRERTLATLRRARPASQELAARLVWSRDKFQYFQGRMYTSGWVWHPAGIAAITVSRAGTPLSSNVRWRKSRPAEAAHGPSAARSGFTLEATSPNARDALGLTLSVLLSTGERIDVTHPTSTTLSADPFHQALNRFRELLEEKGSGRILEIGSRARSGNVYRDWIPEAFEYVGADISAGPNVDVVLDAHEASKHFPAEHFDAIYAISTFEHLAMPWAAALEINKLLKPGGVAYIQTHQTWPVHEAPWDYWRFSEFAWAALFNKHTGFEIVTATMGEPCSVVAHTLHAATAGLEAEPSYLGSCVIARKIGPTDLSWPVPSSVIEPDSYAF